MEYLYALIIVASTLWNNKHDNNIPYFEVNAIFKTYLECNDKIVSIHDYYLAKDIRRKDSVKRKPSFIKDKNNAKVLKYSHNNNIFYASCKKILE